jgi:hypothetical protein
MLYGMLLLFMLFMITANPSDTGENGRDFVGWISSGWDDAREFVDSFVGDAESDTNEFGEIPIPTVDPDLEPESPGPESESEDPPDEGQGDDGGDAEALSAPALTSAG